MNYLLSLVLAAMAFAVGAALLVLLSVKKEKTVSPAVSRLRTAAAAIMAAGAAFGLILACVGVVAKSHGAENSAFTKSSWVEMARMNKASHAVEKEKRPGTCQLFAYVRYGCPDCAAVSEELDAAIQESGLDFAGWYSTRTDIGQELLAEYPVDMVPMLVWLDADGWAETCDPALKTDDGSVVFNETAVEQFFQKIKSSEARDLYDLAGALTPYGKFSAVPLGEARMI